MRVMLVLMLLMGGYGHLVDVNGAFLLGNFEQDMETKEERKLYLEVPQGFQNIYQLEIGLSCY